MDIPVALPSQADLDIMFADVAVSRRLDVEPRLLFIDETKIRRAGPSCRVIDGQTFALRFLPIEKQVVHCLRAK